MRRAATRIFAIALVLGLSACGGVRWHKADGDDATLSKDLADCRRASQDAAGFAGTLALSTPIDPRFGPPPGLSPSEQQMQVSQAVGKCMRGKGYTLVPDAR